MPDNDYGEEEEKTSTKKSSVQGWVEEEWEGEKMTRKRLEGKKHLTFDGRRWRRKRRKGRKRRKQKGTSLFSVAGKEDIICLMAFICITYYYSIIAIFRPSIITPTTNPTNSTTTSSYSPSPSSFSQLPPAM